MGVAYSIGIITYISIFHDNNYFNYYRFLSYWFFLFLSGIVHTNLALAIGKV
jgi:hypothetical protein